MSAGASPSPRTSDLSPPGSRHASLRAGPHGGHPMRVTTGLLAVPLLFVGAAALADEKAGTDGEGFIQQWLVLAPIPLKDGEDGAAGLGREAIPDEAKLKPKAGDKVKAGDKELAWKAHSSKEHLLDF